MGLNPLQIEAQGVQNQIVMGQIFLIEILTIVNDPPAALTDGLPVSLGLGCHRLLWTGRPSKPASVLLFAIVIPPYPQAFGAEPSGPVYIQSHKQIDTLAPTGVHLVHDHKLRLPAFQGHLGATIQPLLE